MDAHQQVANQVFDAEANAILHLKSQLGNDFSSGVEALLHSKGKLIVCGMGKSGLIGNKISATLASTGTPSFSLHPSEAYHGDLGMIDNKDVILIISNSGETEEILKLIPFLRDNKNTIIAMTGNEQSTLAKNCHFHLNIGVSKEACPLNLAPTSSTTASLAMGDALAMALMQARHFKHENFARFHPGGSLGKRLLLKVNDIMKTIDLPFIDATASLDTIIQTISKGRLGMAMIGDKDHLNGIITDGDIRRCLEHHKEQFYLLNAKQLMTKNPSCVDKDAPVQLAIDIMNELNVTVLPVTENNKVLGVVHLYDCNL